MWLIGTLFQLKTGKGVMSTVISQKVKNAIMTKYKNRYGNLRICADVSRWWRKLRNKWNSDKLKNRYSYLGKCVDVVRWRRRGRWTLWKVYGLRTMTAYHWFWWQWCANGPFLNLRVPLQNSYWRNWSSLYDLVSRRGHNNIFIV